MSSNGLVFTELLRHFDDELGFHTPMAHGEILFDVWDNLYILPITQIRCKIVLGLWRNKADSAAQIYNFRNPG